ncbi:hypothetical protein JXC34_05215 [Candidatus Woesearchaeota archaeon]|nr:hypothetical protein [Candidatus Woesearchaeota archaeon]
MKNKSQLTIFFIIGLLVIIVVGVVLYSLNSQKKEDIVAESATDSKLSQNILLLNRMMEQCVKKLTKEVIHYSYMNPYKIGLYINTNIEKCMDWDFITFDGSNIERRSPSTYVFIDDSILVHVNMFINLTEKDETYEATDFIYTIPRKTSIKILQDSYGRVKKEVILLSTFLDAQISIPEGTIITDESGNPLIIDEISLTIIQTPEIIQPYTAYTTQYIPGPSGIHFTQPVVLKQYYLPGVLDRMTDPLVERIYDEKEKRMHSFIVFNVDRDADIVETYFNYFP